MFTTGLLFCNVLVFFLQTLKVQCVGFTAVYWQTWYMIFITSEIWSSAPLVKLFAD